MLLRSVWFLLLWVSVSALVNIPKESNDACITRACNRGEPAVRLSRALLQNVEESTTLEEAVGTRLIAAVRTGSVAAVQKLLHTEVDVDEVDGKGHTPLWEAARRGRPDIVRILLEAGADPSISAANGMTPLYMGAEYGSVAIVEMLLEHGAKIDAPTDKGATPLLMAAQAGKEAVVVLLIEWGAHVSARKTLSQQSAIWSASFFGFHKIIQILIDEGADVNDAETSGATPLYAAAQEGQISAVLALIENKAAVSQRTKSGATPLHVAAAACQVDVVGALLLFNGNPASRDKQGRTPIEFACRGQYPQKKRSQIEELLRLSKGKDLSLEDVEEQGIKYAPPIRSWIKRLLGGTLTFSSTPPDSSVPGLGGENKSRRSTRSGTKFLYISIGVVPSIVVLALLSGFLIQRCQHVPARNVHQPQHQPQHHNNGPYVMNPLAFLTSGSLTESVRTAGWFPTWRTPQIPKPTTSNSGPLDRNPSPLPNEIENSGEFSREALLERLGEVQQFIPSHKWDLESQIPKIAKSEGSCSSVHGVGISSRASRPESFTSAELRSRGEFDSDIDTHVSQELPGSLRESSGRHLRARVDPREMEVFTLRRKNRPGASGSTPPANEMERSPASGLRQPVSPPSAVAKSEENLNLFLDTDSIGSKDSQ